MVEFSHGPYRSQYVLMEKNANGTYRMINDVQPLKMVNIRDAGMPSSLDEYSEDLLSLQWTITLDTLKLPLTESPETTRRSFQSLASSVRLDGSSSWKK